MKRIILLLFVLFIFTKWSNAQCGKKIMWTSVKEEFLDDSDKVQQAHEDSVIVETSDSAVLINHNNIPEDQLRGTVSEKSCDWKEPYKNGKTVIKTNLTEASGETNDS